MMRWAGDALRDRNGWGGVTGGGGVGGGGGCRWEREERRGWGGGN